MTQRIPLTKGQFALVDAADYAGLVALGRWCCARNGYAVHYGTTALGQHTTLYMHRVIYARILGQPIPPGIQVDHINRDRLDCRLANLRPATRPQNQANKGRGVNNTSHFKGVNLNQGQYEARIRYAGKRLHLGRYASAEEAARHYDCASRLLYREFAGVNFPADDTPPAVAACVQGILARYGIQA